MDTIMIYFLNGVVGLTLFLIFVGYLMPSRQGRQDEAFLRRNQRRLRELLEANTEVYQTGRPPEDALEKLEHQELTPRPPEEWYHSRRCRTCYPPPISSLTVNEARKLLLDLDPVEHDIVWK